MLYVIKSFFFVILLFLPICTTSNYAETLPLSIQWVPIDSAARYDQAAFLTAHNAFANVEEGWYMYMMQTLSIENQLKHGVRGFMLDVYEQDNELKLCHGGCKFIHSFQQSVTAGLVSMVVRNEGYKLLKTTVQSLIEWLDRHPLEVITIFIENHADKKLLNETLMAIPGLDAIALKPREWNFEENYGSWPTIGWMRSHNKRLIIFHEDKLAPKQVLKLDLENFEQEEDPFVFWELWYHVIESQYGTLDKEKVCIEREHSRIHDDKERKLYLLNYFGTLASSPAKSRINNGVEMLSQIVDLCARKQLAKGHLPNFIALDFVNEGDGLELVNSYNREMKKELGVIQPYVPLSTEIQES